MIDFTHELKYDLGAFAKDIEKKPSCIDIFRFAFLLRFCVVRKCTNKKVSIFKKMLLHLFIALEAEVEPCSLELFLI
jgi:hypothetical protein